MSNCRRQRVFALLGLMLSACSGSGSAGTPDGAPSDAVVFDAPPADAGEFRLSETGLYSEIGSLTLSDQVLEYSPAYALWSDGAVKTRWILLPSGTAIDTSDQDRWKFPVGTKWFKQFVVDGKPIETRMIWRMGGGDDDYFMGAFLWNQDGTDAVFVAEGERDALGTEHDVPRAVKCLECHQGEPGRAIGFSAIQLSHIGQGLNLQGLAADGLLSDPPPNNKMYPVPGDATTVAALGYLHANCGSCHNTLARPYQDVSLVLRLDVDEIDALGELAPVDSELYATTLEIALERWLVPPYTLRIDPGAPDSSGLLARMSVRGPGAQMPPLGTELVDDDGVAAVRGWISSLSASP